MARYEHLPIYRAAFDLAVHLEKIVKNFSRYHKYTLGTKLRDGSRRVLQRIIEANDAREASDRGPALETLRREVEHLKVLRRGFRWWAVRESAARRPVLPLSGGSGGAAPRSPGSARLAAGSPTSPSGRWCADGRERNVETLLESLPGGSPWRPKERVILRVLEGVATMSRIEEIESAVAELPKEELARFREWFVEFEARVWDREIEEDVEGGRLDQLAEEALRDRDSGRTTEL